MSKYGKEVNQYLLKVQMGDKKQLGRVFDLTANHLKAVAIKYLINPSYCDDVVSDVFCKVLQYISSFDVKQDGYNWLCKITEKVAYTYNEQEKDNMQKTIPLEKIVGVGLEDGGKEIKADMMTAMEKLSQQNKEIVYDYFYLDLTYAEIAARYHIVKSAVHKRVKTSFKIMKKYLEEGEQDK